jgi:hypothetical protein
MVVTRISSQSFEWKMMDQENSGLEFSPISSFCFGLLEEFCQWLDSRKNYVLSHVDLKDDPQPAIITIDIRDME